MQNFCFGIVFIRRSLRIIGHWILLKLYCGNGLITISAKCGPKTKADSFLLCSCVFYFVWKDTVRIIDKTLHSLTLQHNKAFKDNAILASVYISSQSKTVTITESPIDRRWRLVSGQWTVKVCIDCAVYMPICPDLLSQHKISRQSALWVDLAPLSTSLFCWLQRE